MEIIESIIWGIVQGATEFLPVSSSGHLILVPVVFGLRSPTLTEASIAHLGTLLAVLVYFRKDIWDIIVGVLDGLVKRDPFGTAESRLGWFIVIGSIPIALVGFPLQSFFESAFGSPTMAASFLFVTAALIVIGERIASGTKPIEEMTWADSLIIGTFQAGALFPGVSRSGSTIVGGLLRGLDRPTATRFSFLLGIPAILGAGLKATIELFSAESLGDEIFPMFVVFAVSAVVGYGCITWLLQWVRKHSLIPFAIYCVLFGSFYLIFYVWL
ncbi:MAG: undecaprenyl-diphosphatase [Cellvibrionaceae bacterium]|jgi:undecaprenyl-diphosphatase